MTGQVGTRRPVSSSGDRGPGFPLYSAAYDWGAVDNPRFDNRQLAGMKQSCQPHCFSTLNHVVAFCYNNTRVIKWLLRQAAHGFQGVTGSLE